MTFGTRIKLLRDTHEMKQSELAKLLKISEPNMSKYENDLVQPSMESIVKLADIFEVSTDYLLGHKHAAGETAKIPPSENSEKEEIWTLYEQLDPIDRGEVRGEIKGMLRHEKYALTQKERRA